jgi:hypothetical protein
MMGSLHWKLCANALSLTKHVDRALSWRGAPNGMVLRTRRAAAHAHQGIAIVRIDGKRKPL